MSFNLLEAVQKYLTPDFISKASSFLGENENGIRKALSGISPSVLGSIVSISPSNNVSIDKVFNTAIEAYQSGKTNNPDNFFTAGGSLIGQDIKQSSELLGDKTTPIVNAISSYAEIKKSSVNSLFGIITPMASASIGKYAEDNKLTAGGLSTLFTSQQPAILKPFPIRLDGLVAILGISKIPRRLLYTL